MKLLSYVRRILWVIFFLPLISHSQSHKIDSLKTIIRNSKEDTNKLKAIGGLSSVYFRAGNYAVADSLSKVGLALAKKINIPSFLATAYRALGSINYELHNDSAAMRNYVKAFTIDTATNNKYGIGLDYSDFGFVYARQDNYGEAIKNYTQAQAIQEAFNAKGDLIRTYQRIGIAYKKQGNYTEALKYYLHSLKYSLELKDRLVTGDNYINMGNLYIELNNDSMAMQNYQLSLKEYEAGGFKKNMGNAYGNIGNFYFGRDNDSEAVRYYRIALKIALETNDKEGLTSAYGNLGNVFERENKITEALKCQYQSLAIDQEIGDKEGIAEDYINIAGLLIKQKNYAGAKDFLDKALALSKSTGIKIVIETAYGSRASLDTIMGNFKLGYYDYSNYITYRDSLINEENTRKLVTEQMNYEFDKKQAVEKAEQDKKDTVAASEKHKQKIITTSVSLGLLLVLIFSGLLFSRFRVTQKQKAIIEEQKVVVEEKNKEVLDSITYAKRLQDAILPPLGEIEAHFPESFILYKPKDIVAGDFYWMWSTATSRHSSSEEVPEQIIFIAAADCTGHGVPGAMVSVVCSNALNRAVKEFKITDPGKILDKTRELVLETFEKSESDVKDGMDISLCAIQGPWLKWAGAYNPLWLLPHGKNEIKEVAPDKQPVGKQEGQKPFTTRTIGLNKGDIFYLFTDGYADQFGGPEGKKFKYKQLQEKLLSVASLSMREQKQMLEESLQSWKGNLEQVDDILVMGIRV